jgi:hypothetical protein
MNSTEFTLAVRRYAIANGTPETHPRLQGRFGRLVGNLLADGKIDAELVNGRYRIDERHVPLAAALLGLVPNSEGAHARSGGSNTRDGDCPTGLAA